MKVKVPDPYTPTRGAPVVPGNVYSHRSGRPYFRIVLGLVEKHRDRPFNNAICLHVAGNGELVGCSMQPHRYLSEHNDLVGKVDGELPTIAFHFLTGPDSRDA